MISEAVKRLKAHLLMAMSENRKSAIQELKYGNARRTLRDHYLLLKIFPNNQEVPHWQKECRTLLLKTLTLTYLKGNKILPLADYILCVWEGPAEPIDLQIASQHLLADKDMEEHIHVLKSLDYDAISIEYKEFLTHWYNYYNNPHADTRFNLPKSIF